MSSHVYVKVKMRAVDARRFVREFKKEYGDRIEPGMVPQVDFVAKVACEASTCGIIQDNF